MMNRRSKSHAARERGFSSAWLVLSMAVATCLAIPAAASAESSAMLSLPESAIASGASTGGGHTVEARLLIDGDGSRVGVLFDLAAGWHLYWRNPGQTGLPTEVEWQAAGARLGALQWPAPGTFAGDESGLTSYGYEDQVLLWSAIEGHPTSGFIAAELDFLVCNHECIPETLSLQRPAPEDPRRQDGPDAAAESALFAKYASRVPVAPETAGLRVDAFYSRSALRPGDSFDLALAIRVPFLESPGDDETDDSDAYRVTRATFFPDLAVDESIALQSTSAIPVAGPPGTTWLELSGVVEAELEAPLDRLSGVLSIEREGIGATAVRIDRPFPHASAGSESIALGRHWREPVASTRPGPSGAPAADERFGLLHVLVLALLGGILINGMPCVLPVLGIKICSIATLAQRDRRELRHHGYAYAAGTLASMGVLAGVVLTLRAAGTQVGWGFQFQEPIFVAVVTAVVVLFALNLFGVFEIQLATQKLSELGNEAHGVRRSFFDGLLAVVLATPCTAPFLGTAVGFAFAGGPLEIVATFLAIGAGLAAPYSLICVIPGWARFVPKPGNWMMRLRTGLGFLLIGTAVWLLWIFGGSAGVDGVTMLLSLLVALSFGAWLLGWIQTIHHHRAVLAGSVALLLFAIGGLNVVHVKVANTAPPTRSSVGHAWSPFDHEGIANSLSLGQPVFVSFTADWCITCKVNERVVLRDSRVEQRFAELGYAIYRGDWTQRDETIRLELARHGRAGVPLYLLYDPSRPDAPIVLPELLSVDGLLDALTTAATSPPTRTDRSPALASAHP